MVGIPIRLTFKRHHICWVQEEDPISRIQKISGQILPLALSQTVHIAEEYNSSGKPGEVIGATFGRNGEFIGATSCESFKNLICRSTAEVANPET